MQNLIEGGIGSAIVAILALFGVRFQIGAVEKRCDKIEKNVVYSDVFDEFEKRYADDMKDLKDMAKETRADIKNLMNA